MLAKIDTIQASMLRTNILKIGELEEKSFIKEGSTKIIIDNDVEYITTVLHPSREDGRYSRDSNTYTVSD